MSEKKRERFSMILESFFNVCWYVAYCCNFDDVKEDEGTRAGMTRACGDERVVFLAPEFVD